MSSVALQAGQVTLKDGQVSCSCCGDARCQVLPQSLCRHLFYEPVPWAFAEYTAAASNVGDCIQPAVAVSCPPVFYRKKTTRIQHNLNTSKIDLITYPPGSGVGRDTEEVENSKTQEEEWTIVEQRYPDGPSTYEGEGSSYLRTYLGTKFDDVLVGFQENVCTAQVVGVTSDGQPIWDGENAFDSMGFGFDPESQTTPVTTRCATDPGGGVVVTCEIRNPFSKIITITRTYNLDPLFESLDGQAGTATSIISETLSEPVEVLHNLCDEEGCDSDDDPPAINGCNYLCTDRGSGQNGITYEVAPDNKTINDADCVHPRRSGTAWLGTPGCTDPESPRQNVSLSAVLRDLIPGNQYRLTLHLKRCCYEPPEATEENPIDFQTCSSPFFPCTTDSEGNTELVPVSPFVLEFEAEHWGEVIATSLSSQFSVTDPLLAKCQLEDEAAAWNAANPSEPPRTVGYSSDGNFRLPLFYPCYVWFDSCELEDLPSDP